MSRHISDLPRRERLLKIFENRIYDGNLTELSGWDRPIISVPTPKGGVVIPEEFLKRYVYDREQSHAELIGTKELLSRHLTEREARPVGSSSFVLVPGSTAALTVALHYIKQQGVSVVLSDAPYYFSVEKVSKALGLGFFVVPRTEATLDECSKLLDLIRRFAYEKKVIVVTQPRYVISKDYPDGFLEHVLSLLGPNDFLIIDQATDLIFQNPNALQATGRVLKIRSIGKAMSINGARLALLLCDPRLASEVNAIVGYLVGSLDIAMLSLGKMLVENSDLFKRQLNAVQQHVRECVLRAKTLVETDGIQVVAPVNGFLGYLQIDLNKVPRYGLYQHLLRQNVNALFSEQFGMLRPEKTEMLRVNFLLDIDHGLRATSNYAASLQAYPKSTGGRVQEGSSLASR